MCLFLERETEMHLLITLFLSFLLIIKIVICVPVTSVILVLCFYKYFKCDFIFIFHFNLS